MNLARTQGHGTNPRRPSFVALTTPPQGKSSPLLDQCLPDTEEKHRYRATRGGAASVSTVEGAARWRAEGCTDGLARLLLLPMLFGVVVAMLATSNGAAVVKQSFEEFAGHTPL